VHSGNQLRLTVDVSEQMPKDMLAKEVDFTVHDELSHKDADPFAASAGGKTSHQQCPRWVARQSALAALEMLQL